MKKNILFIAGILLLSFFSRLNAQTINYLYVAPTTVMNATFGAANTFGFVRDSSGITVPAMTGYRGTVITAANRANFYTIASVNMRRTYDSIRTSTTRLRIKLDRVMALAGPRIDTISVMMVNDSTGLPNNATVCTQPRGSTLIAWPCASNWKKTGVDRYNGRVTIGERASYIDLAQAGGFRRWEATIIHEFSHTQMLRDTSGVNKWDDPAGRRDGIAISYGGDQGHWFEELQADQQQPMDEGLGYFWALEHNPPMSAELDAFLNRTDHRFLLGSRSFLSGTSAMWNAPHNVICSGPLPCVAPNGVTLNIRLNTRITPNAGGYELRSFRWLDVPGQYVLYNEWMSEAYFYLYHQYAFNSRDTAYNKIYDAVKTLCIVPNQRYRYPAHAANMLANSMEAYARTPFGRQDETNGRLVSSMFAYALFDLLEHFGETDDELRREFNINSATTIPHTPKPLAFQQYLNHRNALRALACPFLGGNNTCTGTGAIDMHRAVTAVRDYFRDPSRILR